MDQRRKVALIAVAAIVLAGVIGADGPGSLHGLPDREAHLPGGGAVIYPTEDDAQRACAPAAVAFADGDARRRFPPGNPAYGRWDATTFPSRGYGCENDLRTNGFGS